MKGQKKLRTIPLLKFHCVMGALVGVILGILYAFGGLIIDALVSLGWIDFPGTPGLSVGTILAFGALIGMPLIFAAIGLIIGVIEWLIYTTFAGFLPWVEINFEK